MKVSQLKIQVKKRPVIQQKKTIVMSLTDILNDHVKNTFNGCHVDV